MRHALAALVGCMVAGCDDENLPSNPPPGSCAAGERVCYFDPIQRRELALRCNEGEVEGAIWITCDGDPTDVILEAGASRRFPHGGLVVQAMRPARIVVYAPLLPFFAKDDRPTPARISAIPAK